MTLDGLYKWQVIYRVFIGADIESHIDFALNDDPEAQDSKQVRIVTAEMNHGNALIALNPV